MSGPLDILHVQDEPDSPAERAGVGAARGQYVALGERLGHRVRVVSIDELRGDGGDWVARLAGSGADLVHLHHVEHRVSARDLGRLVESLPTLCTAYDVSGLCLSQRKMLNDTETCESPLGRPCLDADCPETPAWGPVSAGRGQRDLRLLDKLERLRALRRAKILVHSEYMARQFRLNGFPEQNLLRVLPGLGIPVGEATTQAAEGRLLFAGRLDRNKGVLLLPEILSRLQTAGVTLEVAGEGPDQDLLRLELEARGLLDRIHLRGRCKQDRLIELYDRADLLLIPSLVPESFCLVGVEALARGLPVVAFDVGAVGDWMRDGETGRLIGSGDLEAMGHAIDELLGRPELLAACRRGGIRRVRELFADGKVEAQLEAAYRQTLADVTGRRPGSWSLDTQSAPVDRALTEEEARTDVRWLTPSGGERVLVLAPHFDDEVFGCGGTLALHRAAGDEVRILFLTDGAIGGAAGYDSHRKQRLRLAESRRALAHLEVDEVETLGLADGALQDRSDLADLLLERLRRWRPTRVFAPHAGEWLPDHSATATAAIAAVDRLFQESPDLGRPELLLYEIWTPLERVACATDISAVFERKRQAMLEFHSQLAEFDYERTVTSLAEFRARSLGARESAVRWAEAFGRPELATEPDRPSTSRPLRRRIRPRRRKGTRRLVVLSESPNAPTGFGQVVRHVVGALGRQFDLEVTLLVPHLWPGDLDEDYEICPLGDERHFARALEHLSFDYFFQIKDTYGHGYVGEALRRRRQQGTRFESILYTPIEGALCHRHLSGLRAFDHLVLYNPFSAEVVRRYDPTLVEAERCAIIPHGIDTFGCHPFSATGREEARRRLLPAHVWREGRFTLLNINRNYQRKDLPRSLRVLAEVLRSEPDVYLHLHTNPQEGDFELLEIARSLGLSARNLGFSMQHLGRGSQPLEHRAWSQADITRLYNCADLAFSTSVGEGHGFSTTEAMACGIPFLGPDNTAFSELLADGRGFLAPCVSDPDALTYHAYTEPLARRPVSVRAMAETIVRIVRGELETQTVSAAALDYAKALAWPRVREQWFECFERILGGTP